MHRLAAAVAVVLLLAGCADNAPKAAPASDFDDLGVEATDTTGILLGVVVDEAIRPLQGAAISATGPAADLRSAVTDDQGRFALDGLAPGTYLLAVKLLNYQEAQTVADVVAGDDDPATLRIQLNRLFEQQAFSEQIKFDGFLACAFAFGTSSTCVNDYTRITGEQCIPTTQMCYCAGGCFRDQNLAKAGGNVREYVTSLNPGWQTLVEEMTWKNSSPESPVTSDTLHVTISYFARPDAAHWFGAFTSANPLRAQLFAGVEDDSAQYSGEQPKVIPPEGIPDLFIFYSVGSGIGINQAFQSFQTNFYYGLPPEGWSFVAGDALPF